MKHYLEQCSISGKIVGLLSESNPVLFYPPQACLILYLVIFAYLILICFHETKNNSNTFIKEYINK